MSQMPYIVSHQKYGRNNVIMPWTWECRMIEGVEDTLDYVRGLHNGVANGNVRSITIRKYNAETGKVVEMEPHLNGFSIDLREIVPAEPKTQLQIQRGE